MISFIIGCIVGILIQFWIDAYFRRAEWRRLHQKEKEVVESFRTAIDLNRIVAEKQNLSN